jgi:hypothetical protein
LIVTDIPNNDLINQNLLNTQKIDTTIRNFQQGDSSIKRSVESVLSDAENLNNTYKTALSNIVDKYNRMAELDNKSLSLISEAISLQQESKDSLVTSNSFINSRIGYLVTITILLMGPFMISIFMIFDNKYRIAKLSTMVGLLAILVSLSVFHFIIGEKSSEMSIRASEKIQTGNSKLMESLSLQNNIINISKSINTDFKDLHSLLLNDSRLK